MENMRLVGIGTEKIQEGRPTLNCFVIFTLKEKMQNNIEEFVKMQTL